MTSTPADLDVSIVLPIHNEAGHLQTEIDRIANAMEASSYSWELILVDDVVIEQLDQDCGSRPPHWVIRTNETGGWHGSPHRDRAAQGEIVVWSDAGLTYPNHEIPELIAALGGRLSSALAPRSREHQDLRVPAKWFIRRLAAYLTQTEIDLNTGFRAFGATSLSSTPINSRPASAVSLRSDGLPHERVPGALCPDRLSTAWRSSSASCATPGGTDSKSSG